MSFGNSDSMAERAADRWRSRLCQGLLRTTNSERGLRARQTCRVFGRTDFDHIVSPIKKTKSRRRGISPLSSSAAHDGDLELPVSVGGTRRDVVRSCAELRKRGKGACNCREEAEEDEEEERRLTFPGA